MNFSSLKINSLKSLSWLVLSLFVFSGFVYAEQDLPKEMQDVGIDEKLGSKLPLDAQFKDEDGNSVLLGDYFNKGKPVLISMVYYECPMLCTMVLNGLIDGLNQMPWVPGEKFTMLSVSVKPEETPKLAARKKKTHVGALRNQPTEDGWRFLTGSVENIDALADAIGFRFNRLENGEVAHNAGIFIASPTGLMSRYLYGITYKGMDLKRALLDASDEKQISMMDKVIMFCYRYSKDAQGYVFFAQNFMKTSGYIVLTAVLLLFGSLWYREIRKKKVEISHTR